MRKVATAGLHDVVLPDSEKRHTCEARCIAPPSTRMRWREWLRVREVEKWKGRHSLGWDATAARMEGRANSMGNIAAYGEVRLRSGRVGQRSNHACLGSGTYFRTEQSSSGVEVGHVL